MVGEHHEKKYRIYNTECIAYNYDVLFNKCKWDCRIN